MAAKRRDQKGRVLRCGESQRKDGYYLYRYTDRSGKRHTITAKTLQDLRDKEEDILKERHVDDYYGVGRITVVELVERYVSLKTGVRYNTKTGYNFVLGILRNDPFGDRYICDIRVSDAKRFFIHLSETGKGYSTITSVRGVVKPAFQMAFEEDVIRKNPFEFKLTDIVPNTSEKRIAMTPEQQDTFMTFIKEDKTYRKYYDEFVILLETGMRVSEFCGLTFSDLDFEKRRIRVDHQLVRERGGKYYAERTKTEAGRRFIPMTDNVYRALKNILANRIRPKVEWNVDGYTGFLLLDKEQKPKVALHIENEMRWALKKYHKLHPDKPLPHITPHVFRHTFCTNMALAGMNVKSLQYLMGHSEADITMNVYTHINYDYAAEELKKIVDFQELRVRKCQ